jgi:hypothetical protein
MLIVPYLRIRRFGFKNELEPSLHFHYVLIAFRSVLAAFEKMDAFRDEVTLGYTSKPSERAWTLSQLMWLAWTVWVLRSNK